ncbi:MAG: NAD(+)/NADH kinase [Candidatus Eremiobacteraeota bacterium]|nr:NAD(+)/NADH kinase [Candidatus Eremiobacteraeota bacterium]
MGEKKPGVSRVGVTFRDRHDGAQQAQDRAQAQLESQGVEVFDLGQVLDGQDVDVLLAFGGDGTLLHASRLMASRNIPVLGVNFGRVGYLCAVTEEQLDETLEVLVRGVYRVEERSMLRATILNRREVVWQVDAFNEVLVGGSNRTLSLDVSISGEHIGTIVGDGVIIATRTGSTAYAMSAGGPVVLLESMVLVASNAISSALLAPTVLPMQATVEITNRTKVTRPYVIADGQKDYQILDGTVIQVERSPSSVLLVDPGLVSPLAKLTKKSAERT